MDETSGTSWSDWLQNVAGGVISKASDAKWVQPYQVQQMQLQALGPNGMGGYYTEGQRQQVKPADTTVAGIDKKTLLLVGGAVVLLLVLKRGR